MVLRDLAGVLVVVMQGVVAGKTPALSSPSLRTSACAARERTGEVSVVVVLGLFSWAVFCKVWHCTGVCGGLTGLGCAVVVMASPDTGL